MAAEGSEPGWERATPGDVVGVVIFLVLLAPFARHVTDALAAGDHGSALAGAAFLGIVTSDFVTGFAHWFCDTFFTEQTPVIGRAVIEPFREHHRDPLAMTRRAFLRVSNSNVIGTSVVLAGVWGWRAMRDGAPSVFADAWITSLGLALWSTNQLHKWAHVPSVPWGIARLQATRLILHPAHHARHHVPVGGRTFCVTTGWLNPLLDKARVFERLEWAIRAVASTLLPPSRRAGSST